jgi:hypothetical protein
MRNQFRPDAAAAAFIPKHRGMGAKNRRQKSNLPAECHLILLYAQ